MGWSRNLVKELEMNNNSIYGKLWKLLVMFLLLFTVYLTRNCNPSPLPRWDPMPLSMIISSLDPISFIDGKFISDRVAADFRPDLQAASRADDDWHGFVFNTPRLQSGEHEARVYAVHVSRNGRQRTLQLIGKPLHFQTSQEGTQP